ncbi:hypothetical protein LTR11_011999 [Exophiala xenobiotica]|nr:hypothetical protein LTR11_011999 [Exophiala xenobiotica]
MRQRPRHDVCLFDGRGTIETQHPFENDFAESTIVFSPADNCPENDLQKLDVLRSQGPQPAGYDPHQDNALRRRKSGSNLRVSTFALGTPISDTTSSLSISGGFRSNVEDSTGRRNPTRDRQLLTYANFETECWILESKMWLTRWKLERGRSAFYGKLQIVKSN